LLGGGFVGVLAHASLLKPIALAERCLAEALLAGGQTSFVEECNLMREECNLMRDLPRLSLKESVGHHDRFLDQPPDLRHFIP